MHKIIPAKYIYFENGGVLEYSPVSRIDICFLNALWKKPSQHTSECNTIEKPANGRGDYFKQGLLAILMTMRMRRCNAARIA